jgi:hypothetical protein
MKPRNEIIIKQISEALLPFNGFQYHSARSMMSFTITKWHDENIINGA